MADTVLIVDDDEAVLTMLYKVIRSNGIEADTVASGEEALERLRERDYDAVLLDVLMPNLDGFAVCRAVREGSGVPILFLTALGGEKDVLRGYALGADDYVVKPFGIMELQARVKAVLRRTERRGDRVLTWGDVELDPAAREVHKAGKPVELTYKEFELLKLLFSRRGVALTRDEILQAVWDYDYTGETRTVDMHVKALRQKLGEDIITTVRGVGYKMV